MQNEPEKIPLSLMSTLAKKIFDKYLWWWGTYLKRFETYPVQLKFFPGFIAIHLCPWDYHQTVPVLAACWSMQHVFFKTSRGGTPHSHSSLGLHTALPSVGWILLMAIGIALIDSKRWLYFLRPRIQTLHHFWRQHSSGSMEVPWPRLKKQVFFWEVDVWIFSKMECNMFEGRHLNFNHLPIAWPVLRYQRMQECEDWWWHWAIWWWTILYLHCL